MSFTTQSESEGVRHWARHTFLQSQSVRVKAIHGDSASQKNIRSKTSGFSSQVSRNAKIDHHEETIKESLAARWGTPTSRGGCSNPIKQILEEGTRHTSLRTLVREMISAKYPRL